VHVLSVVRRCLVKSMCVYAVKWLLHRMICSKYQIDATVDVDIMQDLAFKVDLQ